MVVGTEPLTGWQLTASGVYATALEGTTDQLFVDGQMMNLARWPNAPLDPMVASWALSGEGTSNGLICHAQLPDVDLSGAWIKVLPGQQWVATTRPLLTSQRPGLHFDDAPFIRRDYDYGIRPGTPFYIAGSPELLDAPGEWCTYPTKKQLWLKTPASDNPGEHRVEAKRRSLGFSLRERQWIHLEGFRLFACTIDLTDATRCLVENCHLRYPTHFDECDGYKSGQFSGLIVGGSDNVVHRCSIEFSAGNGATLRGERNTLSDCLIRKVNYAAVECGAVFATGKNHVIEHCTLSDSGRSVVTHPGLKGGKITFNELSRAGLLTRDCGLTYTWGDDGEGTEISYNWVHDIDVLDDLPPLGNGIYLDQGCSNFVVHHNVCWGTSHAGIQICAPSRNTLFAFNTVLNKPLALSIYQPKNEEIKKTLFANNVLVGECESGAGLEVLNSVSQPQLRGYPMDGLENQSTQTSDIVKMANQYLKSSSNPNSGPAAARRLRARSSWDFRPQEGSPCIEAAKPIEGFLAPPKGLDIGAYESAEKPWVPGHLWGEPPLFSPNGDETK